VGLQVILHSGDHFVETAEEIFGERFLVERLGLCFEPGRSILTAVFGELQRREIELADGTQVSVVFVPAERDQSGGLRFLAPEVSKRKALVVAGRADEQQIFMIP